MAQKLRFGIMCNGLSFPYWEAECVRQLLPVAEPLLLIVDNGAVNVSSSIAPRNKIIKFFKKLSKIVQPGMTWTLFRRYLVNRNSMVMRRTDLSNMLQGVPVLPCQTMNKGKFSRYLLPKDIEAISGYNLDFIIRFAFGIVRGPILDIPRYGIWSFHHDDIEKYRGGPPSFWEIYRRDPITGAVLQRISGRLDGGVILRKGYFRTAMTSYRLNRDMVYMGSIGWPAQVCRELLLNPSEVVSRLTENASIPIDRSPTAWQLLRFIGKTALYYLQAQWNNLFYADQWNIGILTCSIGSFLGNTSLESVNWFKPNPRHIFIADPIPLACDTNTLLVEGFNYRLGKGYLLAYDIHTRQIQARKVLPVCNSHISYPFSFFDGEKCWCVPEAAATGRLDAWEWDSDRGSWQLGYTLVDKPVLDPTILYFNGKWWLFGTLANDQSDVNLYIWYANRPEGPWEPHLLNPVKCDIRSSRPAGPFFEADGVLFRPAQNCSKTYGGSITINKVVKLTPYSFEEEAVTEILPHRKSPYPDGVHTIAVVGNQVVVDSKRRIFITAASLRFIKSKMERLFYK